ncbi:hypothetical protein [Actinomadura harenae]|uniref:Uncharacterized protein n=1 Tax=Actinomadura harenae TaxID=2483351 RepID=A0A3M2MDI7_9ACTN|nr:hypothetical protein [Actinomadura harenae]RMI47581.1 hypothetical protein EBO15_01380 [Actinomadura harenae]
MARRKTPTPWGLPHKDEERERSITAPLPDSADERWHAAHLIRRRYRRPESWLECLDLGDVPAKPDGWCNCPEVLGAR